MKKQPAKVNYFFKDGYIEFIRVIKNIFKQCSKNITHSWWDVCEHAEDFWDDVTTDLSGEFFPALGHLFMMVFNFCKVLLNIVFAFPLCVILSSIQIVLLGTFMILFYIAFLFVLFSDWIYRNIKKISSSCPKCQGKYALPTYVCECGAKHTSLIPSKYGVLTRTCQCGRKLKTTFFNGRQKLPGKWVCPTCGYELGGPLQVDIPIPVVGGPSSGKTCYISMAISQIQKNAEKEYGLLFEYKENAALEDDYKDNNSLMSKGRLPEKTSDSRLRYYQFYLTPKGEKVRNLVSICDVSGEAYSSNDEIGKQIGFKYADAFLMLVDPLSITAYREEVSKKLDLRKYGASEKTMDEVLDTLIRTLENMKCIDSKSSIKTDVAVIFTKCDIPGLNEKIGIEAVMKYKQQHNIGSNYDAQNKVCEQFLTDYEEENFLNTLKSKFKSIQFFTCSALGHVENGQTFTPDGVEDPALWLIDKASASINLKKKWGRKI